MRPADFAGTQPDFDPISFWTGHTQSWGVIENRAGAPTDIVQTDCTGTRTGQDDLSMQQTIRTGDGTTTHRSWHLHRTSPGHFAATATGMVGTAEGEAAGRTFHWQWIWATRPGDALRNVTMSQWMYAMPDGTMMNHTTVTKLGIVVAQVSEQFSRAAPPM